MHAGMQSGRKEERLTFEQEQQLLFCCWWKEAPEKILGDKPSELFFLLSDVGQETLVVKNRGIFQTLFFSCDTTSPVCLC